MNSEVVGMLAETSVHPGSGQATGFVDLPVAREEATDYPVVRGTSLKGALRQVAREQVEEDERVESVFGDQESAGQIVVSDARLALLPVRSLNGHYRWLTCPHLIERLARDLARAGRNPSWSPISGLEPGGAAGAGQGETVHLEERQFETTHAVPERLIDLIAPLVPHDSTRDRLARQTVVLHDDDFAWFAEYGLEVNARNVLEEGTKSSENLWYEEAVPPDSLFYAVLGERSGSGGNGLDAVKEVVGSNDDYLQVGGNETVGQGWFALQWLDEGGQ